MTGVTIESNLGEIIEMYPALREVLLELGIDPTDHKGNSLCEVCRNQGVEAEAILELAASETTPEVLSREGMHTDWAALSVDDLLDRIIATLHNYLRRKLPRIRLLASKAMVEQPADRRHLEAICDQFDELTRLLQRHIETQETIVFPRIRSLAQARTKPSRFDAEVDRVLAELIEEHGDISKCIVALRELIRGIHLSANVSAAYRSLVRELADLERELERHYYVEVETLIPKALGIEKGLASRKARVLKRNGLIR